MTSDLLAAKVDSLTTLLDLVDPSMSGKYVGYERKLSTLRRALKRALWAERMLIK